MFLVFALVSTVLSTVIYVGEDGRDDNDGDSPNHPVESMQRAYDLASARPTNGVATIHVLPGETFGVTSNVEMSGRVKIVGTDARSVVYSEGTAFMLHKGVFELSGFTIRSKHKGVTFGVNEVNNGTSALVLDNMVLQTIDASLNLNFANEKTVRISNSQFVPPLSGTRIAAMIRTESNTFHTSVSIESCSFEDLATTKGALFHAGTANFTIAKSLFHFAQPEDTLRFQGVSDVSIEECQFTGASIYGSNTDMRIRDSAFAHGTPMGSPGSYNLLLSSSDLRMDGCEFTGSRASAYGAVAVTANTRARVRTTVFTDSNRAFYCENARLGLANVKLTGKSTVPDPVGYCTGCEFLASNIVDNVQSSAPSDSHACKI